MKQILICAGLVFLPACMTVETTAKRVTPAGDVWEGTQRTMAWGGARAQVADQQFVLEIEGDVVSLRSGNGVVGMETPNTVQDVTGLIQALGALVPTPVPVP